MWLSPVVTSAPAVEPISLAQAKEFLRLDAVDTAFDAEVGIHVAGARERIEATTGTRLITQTVQLRASRFADLALLPIGPVQSIVEIRYLDVAGDEQLLAAEAYELVGADLEWSVRPAFGATWPTALLQAGAVTVSAIVGYGAAGTAMPGSVRTALLLITRALFDDKPVDVDAWLANHRIWL